ncbi:hypothetical protein J0A67_03765 [Algoriphagus aestuariicola]|uniref:Glycosyltransferase RgtA/B/C/D-like domain-containing protein n=1 Tax=Algoriphagus aestuariicola TaxID=1852016 RepID=A0ABS3BKY6_9BACT|nr:hypothetical protein [Algoriphagus aestuariicola]MBN7799961.1 hypothetical protein [Algoriphagus aestuariicola]
MRLPWRRIIYFYIMPMIELAQCQSRKTPFLISLLFLSCYWLFSFDGITFSDDVYYLLAGKKFWEGSMETGSYHFSSRWGAYVPSGLMGALLGFEPHRISLVSLLSYLGTLAMLLKVLPQKANPWILVTWSCTQVYFIHFLTKVYPDSLLVFWSSLVIFSAVYRHKSPRLSALGVMVGLFFGFLTKETIVFLAPLPILLFLWDWKKRKTARRFYIFLLQIGFLFGTAYLTYFWAKFGDPLYRFHSIQGGHYVSEYTYADKTVWVMLKRLTISPIITFVERSYWLWLVFALPAFAKLRKNPSSPSLEFGLAALGLVTCFWLMSTNSQFYNPLYLNPRHLIVLVPILSLLISEGWGEWEENSRVRKTMVALITLGVLISLFQQDWKMAGFQALFIPVVEWKKLKMKEWAVAIILLVPALFSVYYQHQLKGYSEFLETLKSEAENPDDQSPILTNNFVHFSREVLLPIGYKAQNLLLPIEKLDSLKPHLPGRFRVLLYDYYLHAYPKEQEDVDRLELFLKENCKMQEESQQQRVWIRSFRMK